MSLTAQQSAQLESLLTDLAEERLDADGRVALEDLLQSEPEARDHYICFMALCSDLRDTAAIAFSAEDEESGNGAIPEDSCHVAASLRDANSGLGETGPRGQARCSPVWAAVVATALTVAIVAFTIWWPDPRVTVTSSDSGSLLGRLEGLTGTVEIGDDENRFAQAAAGQEVRSGQCVVTRDSDAHVAIRLQDGSELMLSGDTRLAFPREDSALGAGLPTPPGHPTEGLQNSTQGSAPGDLRSDLVRGLETRAQRETTTVIPRAMRSSRRTIRMVD